MTWITTTLNALYYISLPITTMFGWLLLPLTPFFHLFNYTFHALFLPIHYLARFESLYIYFSIAALLGLLSGTVLHLTSKLLHSLIDLEPTYPSILYPNKNPQNPKNPDAINASSIHNQKQKENLNFLQQEANDAFLRDAKLKNLPPRRDVISKAYSEYWDTTASRSVSASEKRRGNLLAQTILEEDSDES